MYNMHEMYWFEINQQYTPLLLGYKGSKERLLMKGDHMPPSCLCLAKANLVPLNLVWNCLHSLMI